MHLSAAPDTRRLTAYTPSASVVTRRSSPAVLPAHRTPPSPLLPSAPPLPTSLFSVRSPPPGYRASGSRNEPGSRSALVALLRLPGTPSASPRRHGSVACVLRKEGGIRAPDAVPVTS